MLNRSMVLEIPAAESSLAQIHFSQKLAFETDPADVQADIENNAVNFVLVDVRSAEAYAQSHARGAISIPQSEITRERMAEFPEGTVCVVYCWGPGCNGADKAAMKLSALGRPVKMMLGGIEYWLKEGYPVEQGVSNLR